MLEILALISLTNKIGRIVEQKGYQSSGYKWSTVAWWFGGEILGVIIGLLITGGEQGLPAYIIALIGAAIGASIAYSNANNLPVIGPPVLSKSSSIAQEDSVARMGKLKEMHDSGLITEQEFETKKAEVLTSVVSAPSTPKPRAGMGLAITGLILSLLSFNPLVPCLTGIISVPLCLYVMFRADKKSTKIVAGIGFAIPIVVLIVAAVIGAMPGR